jgi:hypothetical protein
MGSIRGGTGASRSLSLCRPSAMRTHPPTPTDPPNRWAIWIEDIKKLNLAQTDKETRIEIDLSMWRKSKSRNLMQDLLEDEIREGVTIKPKRQGKNQPKELRRSLRNKHGLSDVAAVIEAVEGKAHTYKLVIPPTSIKYESPKT